MELETPGLLAETGFPREKPRGWPVAGRAQEPAALRLLPCPPRAQPPWAWPLSRREAAQWEETEHDSVPGIDQAQEEAAARRPMFTHRWRVALVSCQVRVLPPMRLASLSLLTDEEGGRRRGPEGVAPGRTALLVAQPGRRCPGWVVQTPQLLGRDSLPCAFPVPGAG